MGFGIGSLVEKVCDKIGVPEDFGDVLGLATDGGLIAGIALLGVPVGVGTVGGLVGSALVGGSVTDAFEHADDLVEEIDSDPMTGADWKERIRSSGYASFEDAVASGQVDDDVMNDPGMQALRAEQEARQQTSQDVRNTVAGIESQLTATWRG